MADSETTDTPKPAERSPSPIDRAFLTGQPETGTLILVRHGQQQWPDPATSVSADWVDPPLSEFGRAQAECVGRFFADKKIDAVYSSQLLRANDTGPYTERSDDFRRRVGWAVESTIVPHPGETVVVACHGGVINAYLADLLGLDVDMFFRPFHASSHRVLFGQGRRVIETLNEESYLAAEGLLSH